MAILIGPTQLRDTDHVDRRQINFQKIFDIAEVRLSLPSLARRKAKRDLETAPDSGATPPLGGQYCPLTASGPKPTPPAPTGRWRGPTRRRFVAWPAPPFFFAYRSIAPQALAHSWICNRLACLRDQAVDSDASPCELSVAAILVDKPLTT